MDKFFVSPWIIDCDKSKDGSILIRDRDDWPIAHVNCLKSSNPSLDIEGETNARLMATVPKLYEALDRTATALDSALALLNAVNNQGKMGDLLDDLNFAQQTLAEANKG